MVADMRTAGRSKDWHSLLRVASGGTVIADFTCFNIGDGHSPWECMEPLDDFLRELSLNGNDTLTIFCLPANSKELRNHVIDNCRRTRDSGFSIVRIRHRKSPYRRYWSPYLRLRAKPLMSSMKQLPLKRYFGRLRCSAQSQPGFVSENIMECGPQNNSYSPVGPSAPYSTILVSSLTSKSTAVPIFL